MEANFKSLSAYIAELHAKNVRALNDSRNSLSELQHNTVRGTQFDFLYSADRADEIQRKLVNFFKSPNGSTPYYVAGFDRRGWLMLFKLIGKNGQSTINVETVSICKKKDIYYGIGYRYEHPEQKGENHCFFHVQPIVKCSDGKPLPNANDWTPDHFPTFFMPASDSFSLIIYSLHSIGGRKVITDYAVRHRVSDVPMISALVA